MCFLKGVSKESRAPTEFVLKEWQESGAWRTGCKAISTWFCTKGEVAFLQGPSPRIIELAQVSHNQNPVLKWSTESTQNHASRIQKADLRSDFWLGWESQSPGTTTIGGIPGFFSPIPSIDPTIGSLARSKLTRWKAPRRPSLGPPPGAAPPASSPSLNKLSAFLDMAMLINPSAFL